MSRANGMGSQIAAGLLAHVVASLAGTVAFLVLAQAANPSWETLSVFPLVLLVILVAGFPGFALLRIVLHLARRTAWPWFVAAGAANGALFATVIWLSSWHPFDFGHAILFGSSIIVGAVAGAVYRWTEQGGLTEREGGE
jgi:predicted permease